MSKIKSWLTEGKRQISNTNGTLKAKKCNFCNSVLRKIYSPGYRLDKLKIQMSGKTAVFLRYSTLNQFVDPSLWWLRQHAAKRLASRPSLPWIIVLHLALPELVIRVKTAKPFIWQLFRVDPIWKFSPFQARVALYPVLIRGLPKDMQREVQKSIKSTWLIKRRVVAVHKHF